LTEILGFSLCCFCVQRLESAFDAGDYAVEIDACLNSNRGGAGKPPNRIEIEPEHGSDQPHCTADFRHLAAQRLDGDIGDEAKPDMEPIK
jgi:hypothetical protein